MVADRSERLDRGDFATITNKYPHSHMTDGVAIIATENCRGPVGEWGTEEWMPLRSLRSRVLSPQSGLLLTCRRYSVHPFEFSTSRE